MTHGAWKPGVPDPLETSPVPAARQQPLPVPDLQGAVEGAEAQGVLDQMGLSPQLLTGACVAGLRTAINQYSSYEPSTAFGYQHWAKTVGALREALEEEGWSRSDYLNAPRSVSGDRRFSIAAIKGDDATGQAWRIPANARARGRALVDDVAANSALLTSGGPGGSPGGGGVARGHYYQYYQPVLGTVLTLDVSAPLSGGPGDGAPAPQTWLLLYFWDRSDSTVRSELSLPVACEDGVVTRWRTRVILPPGDLGEPEAAGGLAGGAPPAAPVPDTLPSDDVDFVIRVV